jgi:hypothetical protein
MLADRMLEPSSQDFPPWPTDPLIKLFLYRLKLPVWAVWLTAFAGYWGLPFLISLADGTTLSIGGLNHMASGQGIEKRTADIISLLLQRLPPGANMPYLSDRTHLFFALILATGAAIATEIVRRLTFIFKILTTDGLPVEENPEYLHSVYETYRRLANHWAGKVLAGVLAISVLWFFFALVDDPKYEYWWGSKSHGHAGFAFSIIAGLMVYYGVEGFILVSFGALAVSRIFQRGLTLKPFHPDGCNGLNPVGTLIFLLWAFSVAGSGAIFITLFFGYLGVENTDSVRTLALLGTLALPFIAIVPFFAAVRAVQNAQQEILRAIGSALNDTFRSNITQWISQNNEELLARGSKLQDTYKTFVRSTFGHSTPARCLS